MFFSKTRHILSLPCMPAQAIRLSVGLGDTLELVLLLDGVGVGRTLGGVDELLSKALGNRLDVAESGLTGTDGQEGNGLVDTAEGRDIDGLATDGTGGTNTGGVLTGTAVDDGVDSDLDGVLVGHDVNLCVVVSDLADTSRPRQGVESRKK